MRNHLDQAGLRHVSGGLGWLLTDIGRHSPLWAAPFPRQGFLHYVRTGEGWMRVKASWQKCISSLYSWLCMCVSCLTSCLDTPKTMGCYLGLWANQTFPLCVDFVRVFYHSNEANLGEMHSAVVSWLVYRSQVRSSSHSRIQSFGILTKLPYRSSMVIKRVEVTATTAG